MEYTNDELVLIDSYDRYVEFRKDSPNMVRGGDCKTMVSSMLYESALVITHLEGTNSVTDIRKLLLHAKKIITQYANIKGGNPECITTSVEQNMERLIRVVSKREADMIGDLRLQEIAGEKIDIESIFNRKKRINQLGNQLARAIVARAVNSKDGLDKYVMKYYATETGKKYHTENCPYCKGKRLTLVSQVSIQNQGLKPCKCLGILKNDCQEKGFITAFVDESIRPVAWDENGNEGVAGCYSYIICHGSIPTEECISDGFIISKGVEYTAEHDHIDKITKEAIKKVLFTLAYDINFDGNVQIYTDNKSVVKHWKDEVGNERLSKQFNSVIVSFIPREENRKADRLCRERVQLDMPTDTYKKLVRSYARAEELETRVKELEDVNKKQGFLDEIFEQIKGWIRRIIGVSRYCAVGKE